MLNHEIVIENESLPVRLEQLAEESAELAQAALKLARKLRGESPTPKTKDECIRALHEEAADVQACLMCLEDVIDVTEVVLLQSEKIARWAERLKEE